MACGRGARLDEDEGEREEEGGGADCCCCPGSLEGVVIGLSGGRCKGGPLNIIEALCTLPSSILSSLLLLYHQMVYLYLPYPLEKSTKNKD